MHSEAIKKSGFSEYLISRNELSRKGFSEWIFHPGMLFESKRKWWGNKTSCRPTPHEGLDITYFRNNHGEIKCVDEMIKIPVMYSGVVKKISDDDFLGKSIYVTHEDITGKDGRILHSIYAHSCPYDGIREGTFLDAGDIVCRVVDFKKTKAQMIHHLHISTVFLPEDFPLEHMCWNIMATSERDSLKDPLSFMDIKFCLEEKISGMDDKY